MGGRRQEGLVSVAARVAESVRLEEVGIATLPYLEQVTGATGSLLYRYAAGRRLETLGGSLAATMSIYTPELYARDPLHGPATRLAPKPRIVPATMLVSRKAFHASAAYADFYRQADIEHVVCSWLTDRAYGEPGMVGVMLARPGKAGPFGPTELKKVATLLPALVAAVRRDEALAEMVSAHAALEAVLTASVPEPIVAFREDGRALWMSPAAERLFTLRGGGRAPIPEELAAAVRRLARPGAAIESPRFTLSVTMSDGRPVEAELWLGPPSALPRAIMARLGAGAAARRQAADVARRANLTQAEIKVLAQLANGLSNPEIAERLSVSVETVRTHVKRILGKLGVESRLQAALLVNGGSQRWPRATGP